VKKFMNQILAASIVGGFLLAATVSQGVAAGVVEASENAVWLRGDAQVTSEQLHTLAIELDAKQYMILQGNAVVYTSDDAIDYSGRHKTGIHRNGGQVETGIWLFPEGSVIVWDDGMVDVLDIDTVIVPELDVQEGQGPGDGDAGGGTVVPVDSDSKKCSVTCGRGYYACCYTLSGGIKRCICRMNTVDGGRICVSGGHGATSCSI